MHRSGAACRMGEQEMIIPLALVFDDRPVGAGGHRRARGAQQWREAGD